MAVDVKYGFELITTETLTLGTNIPSAKIPYSISGSGGNVISGSTVSPITKVYAETISLSGNTATLDLVALVYASADISNVSFSGLKVQFIHIKNNGTGDLVVAQGAANPYFFLGVTGDAVTIGKTGQLLLYTPEGLPDVAGGAKDILFTGTGSETFDIHMVAG